MILLKNEIIENIKNGKIIYNGNINNIGPNSIDVSLNKILKTYIDMVLIKYKNNNYLVPKESFNSYFMVYIKDNTYLLKEEQEKRFETYLKEKHYLNFFNCLDLKKENEIKTIYEIPEEGVILLPGLFYLGSTNEIAGSEYFVPMYEGRSSTARLGLQSHISAGFGDIGFINQWTLEIQVLQPLKIYPNFRIGQVYFYNINNKYLDKNNNYKGKYSKNNIAQKSLIYKDFIK